MLCYLLVNMTIMESKNLKQGTEVIRVLKKILRPLPRRTKEKMQKGIQKFPKMLQISRNFEVEANHIL